MSGDHSLKGINVCEEIHGTCIAKSPLSLSFIVSFFVAEQWPPIYVYEVEMKGFWKNQILPLFL